MTWISEQRGVGLQSCVAPRLSWHDAGNRHPFPPHPASTASTVSTV